MIAGRASIEWGECAALNPPVGPGESVLALYDYLGEAAAWGALAARLGMPAGRELVGEVARFVAVSPTIAGGESIETGAAWARTVYGLAGDAILAAERAAPKGWARVTRAADAVLERLGRVPLGLAAVGLGALYVTGSERVALSAIESKKTLVGETLARMSPEEAKRALKDLDIASLSGSGFMSWLPWVLGAGALLLAWRWLR